MHLSLRERTLVASACSSTASGASTTSNASSTQMFGSIPTSVSQHEEALQDLADTVTPYTYPVPLVIRRTFLEVETAALRSPSLEAFVTARRAHSCPRSGSPGREERALVQSMSPTVKARAERKAAGPQSSPRDSSACASSSGSQGAGRGSGRGGSRFHLDREPWGGMAVIVNSIPHMMPKPPGAVSPASYTEQTGGSASETGNDTTDEGDDASAIAMSPATSTPGRIPVRAPGHLVLGSPAMPTVGSAGHHMRRCKPCAFVQKGCMSGVECKFCHLCECGEKKRRKKEKVAMRREANKYRLAQSSLKWGKSASVQW